MPGSSETKPIHQQYRDAVARLDAARTEAIEERRAIEAAGDVEAGRGSLEKLHAAVEEFKDLRTRISPTDLFVIEYNVEVVGPTRVSLVVPAHVAPLDVINRSQDVSMEVFGGPAFSSDLVRIWAADRIATHSEPYSRKLEIDGFVQGTLGKSIDQQDAIMKRRGLTCPSLVELGLAHAAYLLATEEDLFQGKKVRADRLALFVMTGGVHYDSLGIYSDTTFIASAARLSKSLEESEP